MKDNKVAVVAVGGNALIKDKTKKTIPDQYEAANETMGHIAEMIRSGCIPVAGSIATSTSCGLKP